MSDPVLDHTLIAIGCAHTTKDFIVIFKIFTNNFPFFTNSVVQESLQTYKDTLEKISHLMGWCPPLPIPHHEIRGHRFLEITLEDVTDILLRYENLSDAEKREAVRRLLRQCRYLYHSLLNIGQSHHFLDHARMR